MVETQDQNRGTFVDVPVFRLCLLSWAKMTLRAD